MMNELYDREDQLTNRTTRRTRRRVTRAALTVSEQYIDLLVKLRKQYDEIDEKYDQLAADANVQKALKGVSKDGAEFKLGPSGLIRRLGPQPEEGGEQGPFGNDHASRGRGPGRLDRFRWCSTGHPMELMVDTGAYSICLPYKAAVDAGLAPSGNAPTIQCRLADGHIVECKQVYAQTVRLGKFTVENVECGVMPADCPDAASALGQSFLRHFTYKIDSVKGKLTMTQIEGDKGRGKPAKGEPRGRRPPKGAPKTDAPKSDE